MAAKGGNKANVEQCRSDSTGFRNLGQCVSSGAKGAPQPQPQLDFENNTYPGTSPSQCPGIVGDPNSGQCWGTLIGSGLNPNTQWIVFDSSFVIVSGKTDSTGSINQRLFLVCGLFGGRTVVAEAMGPAGTVAAFAGSDCG